MLNAPFQSTDLFKTILNLESIDECEKFFRDLMTISELEAISERWEIAKLINEGISYRKISEQTGASTATVTRVAQWLNHGMGGYRMMLEKKINR